MSAAPQTDVWAEIILPLATPANYTYKVPGHLIVKAQPGVRAEVEFAGTKRYAGIIKSLTGDKPDFPTRDIINILDEKPVVFDQQLRMWQWISEYYMCTQGEVMAAALPANFKLSSETLLIYNEEHGQDLLDLDNEEYVVAEALEIKKQLKLTEVQQLLDVNNVYPRIKKLIELGICYTYEHMQEKFKARVEYYVHLHPDFDNEEKLADLLNNWKGAPKQLDLLLALIHFLNAEGAVTQADLLHKSGATAAQLKGLVTKNIVAISRQQIDRVRLGKKFSNVAFELTAAQSQALAEVQENFSAKNVCLLHGVTGSGKTQVYLKLLEKVIEDGRQALYLLPEIALTAQVIRRLQVHFGGHIAIYHSKFSHHERIELWNKVNSGEVRIVLGARSAIFLPFKALDIIIVDEEHDQSFKQTEPAPRYHARDVAIFLSDVFNAKVLLGSATPSFETYFNARAGKYGLVELNERFGGLQLPSIEIVNTAYSKTGKTVISDELAAAIGEALSTKKQVILFQNRRGYDPYIICSTCGFIPQCVHCDVSLTLHKYSNKMHCHYCGSTYPKIVHCPQCQSVTWMEKNFGTEKVEEILLTKFEDAHISRMDIDSTKGKRAHDNLIKQFEDQKINILVGTQMVVKGLDFDNVGLVGILDADGLLQFADFRVNERGFQLMEQVSGRAGRKKEQGRVLIQAINISHFVLQMVQAHDYKKLYETELEKRRDFFYPPYCRLVNLLIRHKDPQKANDAAEWLAKSLRQDFTDLVFGPSESIIPRLRNLYRREILVKIPKQGNRSAVMKSVIRTHISLMLAQPAFRSVQVLPDVDPY